MQDQFTQQQNLIDQNNSYEANSINQDLIKLRQMNQAFNKMNQHHMYPQYQYYMYEPCQIQSFEARELYSVQQSLQQKQAEDATERSNSLLFTLSQKDQEQTRPTTNVQHLQYEYDTSGNIDQINDINKINQHRFGSYQYNHSQSMTVNNTLLNNVFQEQDNSKTHNIHPYPQQVQIYHQKNNNWTQNHQQQYPNHHQQYNYNHYESHHLHQQQTSLNGFSKYEEFAVKISKLFNIHVEDLELIYNQLKFEKQTEYQQAYLKQQNTPTSNPVISDSEVMKKLFSYALQIKNSHNQLKNMITTIDQRKNHKVYFDHTQNINKKHQNYRNRPQTHIPQKTQLQNISINFMLEQQHQNISQPHQYNESHFKQDNQTKRIPLNKHHPVQTENIESKKTIIQKLVSQKGNLNSQLASQQTILSHSSYADSNITNTKTNKSKKKSRVTEKIKLISQQLESLKKEIDLDEDVQNNAHEKENNQHQNESHFKDATEQQNLTKNEEHQPNGQAFSFQQQIRPVHEYLPNLTRQISQYVIQVNQSQAKSPTENLLKTQTDKQSESHTFGGESFTYIKSIQQLPIEDPDIDFKIQQTIKTCIVKSPSKKILNQSNHQLNSQKNPLIEPESCQQKNSQKIIVEQGQTSNSHSKYSFKRNSQVSKKDNNQTMITSPDKSQIRQKMFKSIAEMRKNHTSKDKLNNNSERHWSRSKTTNNAYLEDENISQDKNQSYKSAKNVVEPNSPKVDEKIPGNFAKPKFFTKQVMKDGKLVFEKSQIIQSQHKIRQSIDERKETATFGIIQPSQTDKFIKINQAPQYNQVSQVNQLSSNLHSSHTPIIYYSNLFQPHITPKPNSNTMIEGHEENKKTLSMGVPSSLYSGRTIQSRPFIESEGHLPKPISKTPVYMYPTNNIIRQQKYEYVPKLIHVKKNSVGFPSNTILSQSHPRQLPQTNYADPKLIKDLRPVTPKQVHQVYRPVTPINKIQSINIQVSNREKPRSFSVQRIMGRHNIQEGQRISLLNGNIAQSQPFVNNTSQIRIAPPGQQKNRISRPQIINSPVSERRIVQRPFSVPIRSMTPERNMPIHLKQTLIQKPKVVQSNYTQTNIMSGVKRSEPQTPVIIKQFQLKSESENIPQQINLSQQQHQHKHTSDGYNTQESKLIVKQQQINLELSKKLTNSNLTQSKPPQASPPYPNPPLHNSKHTNLNIQNFPHIITKRPDIPPQPIQNFSQPQLRNPKLDQSEMYYGQLKGSARIPHSQMPTNYKEMNLMSSRRTDSVVHTFPVQMEQSSKMNNSIYTKDEAPNHTERMNHANNKPAYGQIITYQPPTSPKNPFSQQTTRIPNNFRPPKYIPPKQQPPIQEYKHINHQILPNHNQSLSKPTQNSQLHESSQPPIKTYTMGHLLQASKTQQYMKESIIDDRKSNTALNASYSNAKFNDLHDSTPSFGRIHEQNGAQSLVISPFSKELSNLNQSRNSSASKRQSSSRSRSNRKGIALESKRSKSPSHKFFQSSYDH